jgi:hypothetical protein
VQRWFDIRDALDPAAPVAWEEVIKAVELRLRKRFVEPGDAIIAHDEPQPKFPEGRGFAVVAIDCLLLETIYGLRLGRHTTLPESRPAFIDVLTQNRRFSSSFKDPGRADSYFTSVRNSVLHDGETRDGWVIWKSEPDDPIVYDPRDGRLVLHRDALHAAMTRYLADYLGELRDIASRDPREKLRQRLNRLCDDSRPKMRAKGSP